MKDQPFKYQNQSTVDIPKKENPIEQESLDKLKKLIFEIYQKLIKEGIAITDDCRIDMDMFKEIFSAKDIELDKKYIETMKKKFEEDSQKGDPMELLTTIIWNKILGDKLIVVRTSVYDDIKNGVDHLIIEKNTGKVICAIDDVASISSFNFHDKKDKTSQVNTKKIKYGMISKNEQISLTSLENIPVFYLGFDLKNMSSIIKEMSNSFDDKPSETEKKLMNYYLGILEMQIKKNHLGKIASALEELIPDTIKQAINQSQKKKHH